MDLSVQFLPTVTSSITKAQTKTQTMLVVLHDFKTPLPFVGSLFCLVKCLINMAFITHANSYLPPSPPLPRLNCGERMTSCMHVYYQYEHNHIRSPNVSDTWEGQSLSGVRFRGMFFRSKRNVKAFSWSK